MKSMLLSMTAVAGLLPCGAALAQTAKLPTGQELAWSSAASRVGAFKPRPWAARGTNVTIAIIDSGIRRDHIDFAGAITGGYNAFTNLTGTTAVNDTSGHGTHVASLAAARANGVGMVGIASNARILPIQVFMGSSTSDFYVARGINYATSQKAFVMNLSLGGSTMSPTIRTALQGAQKAGLLMVIAAGNEGLANPSFPARHASEAWAKGQIIAVGAVDANNVIASFSNRAGDARNFYLVAPGVNLIGAYPSAPNAYVSMSGTSMAAPVVAGAAAVVKSAWPFLTAPKVAEVLFVTATDLGAKGIDPIYGRGLCGRSQAKHNAAQHGQDHERQRDRKSVV
jgi:subtilisin family serine protease